MGMFNELSIEIQNVCKAHSLGPLQQEYIESFTAGVWIKETGKLDTKFLNACCREAKTMNAAELRKCIAVNRD